MRVPNKTESLLRLCFILYLPELTCSETCSRNKVRNIALSFPIGSSLDGANSCCDLLSFCCEFDSRRGGQTAIERSFFILHKNELSCYQLTQSNHRIGYRIGYKMTMNFKGSRVRVSHISTDRADRNVFRQQQATRIFHKNPIPFAMP